MSIKENKDRRIALLASFVTFLRLASIIFYSSHPLHPQEAGGTDSSISSSFLSISAVCQAQALKRSTLLSGSSEHSLESLRER